MSNAKRKELTGRGAVGKTAIAGTKDRVTNQVASADKETQQGFVTDHTEPDATVYADEASAFERLPRAREAVKHSVSEYVRGKASTNGVESFWSMLKRAHESTFHKISPKHLNRYVQEWRGEA